VVLSSNHFEDTLQTFHSLSFHHPSLFLLLLHLCTLARILTILQEGYKNKAMNPYGDYGYNSNSGGAPRVPPRPGAPYQNDQGSGSYNPRTMYGGSPAPDTQPQYMNQNSYGQPAPRQYHQSNQPPSHMPQHHLPPKKLRAIRTAHESYAFTNYVVGNPQDFEQYFSQEDLKDSSRKKYILVKGHHVFCLE